jgi:hypothetical protein
MLNSVPVAPKQAVKRPERRVEDQLPIEDREYKADRAELQDLPNGIRASQGTGIFSFVARMGLLAMHEPLKPSG